MLSPYWLLLVPTILLWALLMRLLKRAQLQTSDERAVACCVALLLAACATSVLLSHVTRLNGNDVFTVAIVGPLTIMVIEIVLNQIRLKRDLNNEKL